MLTARRIRIGIKRDLLNYSSETRTITKKVRRELKRPMKLKLTGRMKMTKRIGEVRELLKIIRNGKTYWLRHMSWRNCLQLSIIGKVEGNRG